ncbi:MULTISPECIES: hypothetical protein [Sphingobacterium]|uniref:Uncharacterized protein n=1 Tax=Sphingobacterium siyangense TaxID=459529 RepID=A0A562M6D9_9SPHI|nr:MULTISPECIES: hypothetical protein [Sphingobacterium]TWI15453.1 hypothetical protein IQ31_05111 [Sphingobacterium siyangense]
MKMNKENFAISYSKMVYEAPSLHVQKVELEYGIAAASVDPGASKQWESRETQSHEVVNDYWD